MVSALCAAGNVIDPICTMHVFKSDLVWTSADKRDDLLVYIERQDVVVGTSD